MMSEQPKYRRLLLKLSGEALQKEDGEAISAENLNNYIAQIKSLVDLGVELGIVIGGGNIFRGVGNNTGIDRLSGDYMGMMATVINSIGLQAALKHSGIDSLVLTAIRMEPVAEFYSREKAHQALSEKKVVIFSAGTGNPYFTTDSAAALRAVEINADALLKGTKVDGVYTADPKKDATATKYQQVTFDECLAKKLQIMDMTAFSMCRDNHMPIVVFDINQPSSLKKIALGENIGTVVNN